MTLQPSFWARRLANVKKEAEPAPPPETEVEGPAKTDEEILDMLELPDPDSLRSGDDFAAFMAKAVPQHIRNRALRKLWRSNPVLACLDGLNDYDDDYLTGSTGNGPIKTTYQVGKGLLAHVQEMARVQAAAVEDEKPEPVVAEPVVAVADCEEADCEDDHAAPPAAVALTEPMATEQDTVAEAVSAPRRMQFHFEGGAR